MNRSKFYPLNWPIRVWFVIAVVGIAMWHITAPHAMVSEPGGRVVHHAADRGRTHLLRCHANHTC